MIEKNREKKNNMIIWVLIHALIPALIVASFVFKPLRQFVVNDGAIFFLMVAMAILYCLSLFLAVKDSFEKRKKAMTERLTRFNPNIVKRT